MPPPTGKVKIGIADEGEIDLGEGMKLIVIPGLRQARFLLSCDDKRYRHLSIEPKAANSLIIKVT